ncbi:anthranilate synthase component I family protein [Prochlorococcus marinus]|uniref:Anthranilate synthase component I n=1 Tax=Prochlorococcus marinus XMU1408 TaxID=2213228 RepID=A0A318R1Z5_PROMR|nr:chorismate-binding protein [Prochlorococcus marinus]MBW3042798.1 anthranilate synthase component I [Prochlorococcus marinus str. XMU1408]PYE00625.1 anthranilate synthase component I [Prochlorococcus marinus XMU1408]
MHSSDKKQFLLSASSGANYIPLAKSWPADLETPLSTWLKVGNHNAPGVLLESVEGGENIGRWSVVASDPLWKVIVRGNELTRLWRDGKEEKFHGSPIETLRKMLAPYKSVSLSGLPQLGQLFGMWGYELIQWIEPSVPTYELTDQELPDGIWMFMDKILIFDQVKRLITAVAYGNLSQGISVEKAYETACKQINELQDLMAEPLKPIKSLKWNEKGNRSIDMTFNTTKSEFENSVRLAKEFIKKGDVFQLVLSQKLESTVSQKPFELYRSLRMVNPSPFMAFFDFGDWQLIGSSPEVMVKAQQTEKGIQASLRPIAGTRPRGKNELEDAMLEKDLLKDPKERAEHVMLVDLGRNDLGRVCFPGSVFVKELMVIEKYSHVMHIVSEVEGYLEKGKDVWDLLIASFPAGTVSGAPKIRAMQLINQLEKQRRGPYSGVYGSIDLNGALNTAITIRTMVVRKKNKHDFTVQVQAGAGVVADSIPSNEYQETLNKARGMFTALACLVGPDL